jgi:hypothetical protein
LPPPRGALNAPRARGPISMPDETSRPGHLRMSDGNTKGKTSRNPPKGFSASKAGVEEAVDKRRGGAKANRNPDAGKGVTPKRRTRKAS